MPISPLHQPNQEAGLSTQPATDAQDLEQAQVNASPALNSQQRDLRQPAAAAAYLKQLREVVSRPIRMSAEQMKTEILPIIEGLGQQLKEVNFDAFISEVNRAAGRHYNGGQTAWPAGGFLPDWHSQAIAKDDLELAANQFFTDLVSEPEILQPVFAQHPDLAAPLKTDGWLQSQVVASIRSASNPAMEQSIRNTLHLINQCFQRVFKESDPTSQPSLLDGFLNNQGRCLGGLTGILEHFIESDTANPEGGSIASAINRELPAIFTQELEKSLPILLRGISTGNHIHVLSFVKKALGHQYVNDELAEIDLKNIYAESMYAVMNTIHTETSQHFHKLFKAEVLPDIIDKVSLLIDKMETIAFPTGNEPDLADAELYLSRQLSQLSDQPGAKLLGIEFHKQHELYAYDKDDEYFMQGRRDYAVAALKETIAVSLEQQINSFIQPAGRKHTVNPIKFTNIAQHVQAHYIKDNQLIYLPALIDSLWLQTLRASHQASQIPIMQLMRMMLEVQRIKIPQDKEHQLRSLIKNMPSYIESKTLIALFWLVYTPLVARDITHGDEVFAHMLAAIHAHDYFDKNTTTHSTQQDAADAIMQVSLPLTKNLPQHAYKINKILEYSANQLNHAIFDSLLLEDANDFLNNFKLGNYSGAGLGLVTEYTHKTRGVLEKELIFGCSHQSLLNKLPDFPKRLPVYQKLLATSEGLAPLPKFMLAEMAIYCLANGFDSDKISAIQNIVASAGFDINQLDTYSPVEKTIVSDLFKEKVTLKQGEYKGILLDSIQHSAIQGDIPVIHMLHNLGADIYSDDAYNEIKPNNIVELLKQSNHNEKISELLTHPDISLTKILQKNTDATTLTFAEILPYIDNDNVEILKLLQDDGVYFGDLYAANIKDYFDVKNLSHDFLQTRLADKHVFLEQAVHLKAVQCINFLLENDPRLLEYSHKQGIGKALKNIVKDKEVTNKKHFHEILASFKLEHLEKLFNGQVTPFYTAALSTHTIYADSVVRILEQQGIIPKNMASWLHGKSNISSYVHSFMRHDKHQALSFNFKRRQNHYNALSGLSPEQLKAWQIIEKKLVSVIGGNYKHFEQLLDSQNHGIPAKYLKDLEFNDGIFEDVNLKNNNLLTAKVIRALKSPKDIFISHEMLISAVGLAVYNNDIQAVKAMAEELGVIDSNGHINTKSPYIESIFLSDITNQFVNLSVMQNAQESYKFLEQLGGSIKLDIVCNLAHFLGYCGHASWLFDVLRSQPELVTVLDGNKMSPIEVLLDRSQWDMLQVIREGDFPELVHEELSRAIVASNPIGSDLNKNRYDEIAQIIHALGALCLGNKSDFNQNILHVIAAKGLHSFVAQVIEVNKELAVETDKRGYTPLHFAIDRQDKKMVQLLTDNLNADYFVQTMTFQNTSPPSINKEFTYTSPLKLSIATNQLNIAQSLLNKVHQPGFLTKDQRNSILSEVDHSPSLDASDDSIKHTPATLFSHQRMNGDYTMTPNPLLNHLAKMLRVGS